MACERCGRALDYVTRVLWNIKKHIRSVPCNKKKVNCRFDNVIAGQVQLIIGWNETNSKSMLINSVYYCTKHGGIKTFLTTNSCYNYCHERPNCRTIAAAEFTSFCIPFQNYMIISDLCSSFGEEIKRQTQKFSKWLLNLDYVCGSVSIIEYLCTYLDNKDLWQIIKSA